MSELPPVLRDPITKSASFFIIGETKFGMSFSSWDPSASKKTRLSFFAFFIPIFSASPLPFLWSRKNLAPKSFTISFVPSLEWPSTTIISVEYF